MRTSLLLVSLVGAISLGAVACGSSSYPPDDDDDTVDPGVVTPGSGGDNPADAGVTVVPPNCDSSKTPSQDACVVIEALGIFVAPPAADAGADAGEGVADGTRARPFHKIQDAITAAQAQKKRVYACAATYAEQVTLADGVSMFGDLDCANWTPVSAHAKLAPTASPVMTATTITTATRVEAFDLSAPDGTADAPSSIALVATGTTALTFAQSTLHAGKGANGADGVDGVQLSNGNVTGANGLAQYVASASLPLCSSQPQTVNTCVGAAGFSGGTGGSGGWGGHWVVQRPQNGFAGVVEYQLPSPTAACPPTRPCVCTNQDGAPNAPSATTAQGGYEAGGADPGPRPGASGVAGQAGNNGTSGVAMITLDGGMHYLAGDGQPGTNGAPGQGGGGGKGSPAQPLAYADGTQLIGGVGASGGAGGCPGLAGTAGKGGGASIVVLSTDSPIVFDTCNLQASDAGNGGKGTTGSNPTNGGGPGIDYANTAGTAGGSGGTGGAAGWSGSGAGGWSAGVVSHGAAPIVTTSTVTFGKAGLGVAAITANGKTIPATTAGLDVAATTF